MFFISLFPFRQKVNSQSQPHNAYIITPIHLLIVVIVLSLYHRPHHQWSSQQKEWRIRRIRTIGWYICNKYSVLITRYVPVRSASFVVKCVKQYFVFAYAALWWRNMIFVIVSSLESVQDTVQYRYCTVQVPVLYSTCTLQYLYCTVSVLYSTGTVLFHCSIVPWELG